jgi:hypothetical protein
MGFSRGNEIFDPVAYRLIEADLHPAVTYEIARTLIDALLECDWDTADESLDEFEEFEPIRGAFRECGIFKTCTDIGQVQDVSYWCEKEFEHTNAHSDLNGHEW